MKRLLSIVLALVLVLGTLPVFAYDYNVAGKTAGQMLYDNGFISGNNGNLMEAEKLNRAQLAKILCVLYGKEKEAEAFEANHGFTDVPAGHWANPWIAYAKQEGWMKGRNEKTFDPNGTVDEKQLATVLLRVLGFETKDDEYNNAAQIFAAKTAIVLDANKAFSRGQAFDAIWPAVSTPVKADGKILGEVVGKLNPPTPDPLSIKDVQANNLKEIVVKFSKEVKDVTKESFSLSDNLKISNVKLAEDALSVVITTETKMTNQSKYKLSVSGIKPLDEKTPKFVDVKDLEFDCFDKELPTVTNVEFTGPKHITISFSEPIQMGSGKPEFKFATGTMTPNNSKTQYDENKVTYELYTNLKADTKYTVVVKEFKDLAGYNNVNDSFEKVFVKDTTAPTVEVVESNQETVTLKFSKPVKGLQKDQFSHSFAVWTAKDLEIEKNNSDFTSKVVVVFWKGDKDDKALPQGDVVFTVNGKNIKDLWGNELGVHEFTLKISADKTAPSVVEFKPVKNTDNQYTVKFSKAVALDASHILAKNNDVAVSAVKVTPDAKDKTVFTVVLPGVKQGSKVSIEIKDAKDTTVNTNVMEKYTNAFTVEDTKAPEIKAANVTYNVPKPLEISSTNDPATLTLWFSEPLDSSALTMANYILQTKDSFGNITRTKFAAVADFVPGNSAVKLTITDIDSKKLLFKDDSGAKMNVDAAGKMYLEISGIKDIYNNAMNTISLDAYSFVKEDGYQAEVESVVIVDDTTAEVLFKNYIKKADSTAFTINDSTENLTAETHFKISIDEKKVIINLVGKKFPVDLKSGLKIAIADKKIETIEDLTVKGVAFDHDGSTTGSEKQIVEKIVPEIVLEKVSNKDVIKVEADNTVKTITFTFNEAIKVSNPALLAQELGISVKVNDGATAIAGTTSADYGTANGYTITTNDKKLVITFQGTNAFEFNGGNDTIHVTFTKKAFEYITDISGNKVKVPAVLETKELK